MKVNAIALAVAVISFLQATLFAGKIYYFDPVNGKDSNNGLTEATAFQNLSKKSGSCSQGDEFRLMEGVYTNRFVINSSNVTVRGWNASRDRVIIDGQHERRGIGTNGYSDEGFQNATIADLTVRNCRHETTGSNYGNLGAGVIMMSANFLLTNCVIASCVHASHSGGGVALSYSGAVVDCIISNCSSVVSGGGIYMVPNGANRRLEIRNCTIADNVSMGTGNEVGGGGIMAQYGTIISNCVVTGNSSARYGGGILFCVKKDGIDETPNEIYDTVVSSNTAPLGGGIQINDGHTNRFFRVTFEGNVATTGSGGGSWGGNPYLYLSPGCKYVGNRAATTGGGLYAYGIKDNPVVGVLFKDNGVFATGSGTSARGGGVETSNSGLFESCVFDGNFCTNGASNMSGGGFHLGGESGQLVTFRNCLFTRNFVENGYGGAIGSFRTRNVTADVENCTFVGNRLIGTAVDNNAGYGAALSCVSGRFNVTNSVFYQNTSSCRTTSVQVRKDKLVSHGYNFENYLETKNANAFADGVNGCIVNADPPGFTDAAKGDYSLAKGSQLIDKGVNQGWMDSATDIRRREKYGRLQNGIVDLGCYEWWPFTGLILLFR